MRNLLFLSIILLIVISCSCKHPPVSGWKYISIESDSIIECLESGNLNYASDREKKEMTDCLLNLAEVSGNRQLLCRAAFWRAALNYQQCKYNEAKKDIFQASVLQDSLRYKYDNMRIRLLRAKINQESPVEQYKLFTDALDYYLNIGDTVMAGTVCMDLGNVFHHTGNLERAREFYMRAENMFHSPRAAGERMRNRLNIANVSSDDQKQKIYRDLRDSSVLKEDSIFTELLWRNSFLASDELAFLDTADNYVRYADRELVAMHLVWRADYWRRHAEPDSAVKYAIPAFQASMEDASIGVKALAVLNNCFALYAQGDVNEALQMFPLYVAAVDSLMTEQSDRKVAEADSRMLIEKADRKHSEDRKKSILIGIVLITILISGSAVLAVWLIKSRKIAEMRREMADLELMRRQDKLILSAMSIESKNKIIATLSESVEKLCRNKKIEEMDAMAIKSQLRADVYPDSDLDTLLQLREKLNPEFEMRLKADYPDLSENHLRLASLIAVGLSNKQIADILMISHASVNTARYRLRMKVGLSKGDSLEDFLRRYRQ